MRAPIHNDEKFQLASRCGTLLDNFLQMSEEAFNPTGVMLIGLLKCLSFNDYESCRYLGKEEADKVDPLAICMSSVDLREVQLLGKVTEQITGLLEYLEDDAFEQRHHGVRTRRTSR